MDIWAFHETFQNLWKRSEVFICETVSGQVRVMCKNLHLSFTTKEEIRFSQGREYRSAAVNICVKPFDSGSSSTKSISLISGCLSRSLRSVFFFQERIGFNTVFAVVYDLLSLFGKAERVIPLAYGFQSFERFRKSLNTVSTLCPDTLPFLVLRSA